MTIRFARMLENAPEGAIADKRKYEVTWTNKPDNIPFIAKPLEYTVWLTTVDNLLVVKVVATDIHSKCWVWREHWCEVQT